MTTLLGLSPLRPKRLLLLALSVGAVSSVVLAKTSDGGDASSSIPPPGSKIVSSAGSCLTLTGLRDATIEDLTIGPCAGHGIELRDSHNVTIRKVTISDTAESGIYVIGSTSVHVEENKISNTISGVYMLSSSAVDVSCNTLRNPRGPIPRGQFVQFDKVYGADNHISCNLGRNEQGQGQPEDAINLYKSQGTPQSPITVADNLIMGGGPSLSGGGIMLGDDGGSYQIARDNVLVDPGQYGIAVASGDHVSVLNNLVFSRRQPFTNVGIYAWNQYPHACHTIQIEGNKVNWTSKSGSPNPFWDGENCGTIAGIRHNQFSAPLSAQIADTKAPQCSCLSEGRR